jgi:hypothetical protein
MRQATDPGHLTSYKRIRRENKEAEAPDVDLTSGTWRTSSYSGGNGGQCIQVAAITGSSALCAVRDSRDHAGPALMFGSRQWRTFTVGIKAAHPAPA